MSKPIYFLGKNKETTPKIGFFDVEGPVVLGAMLLLSGYLPAWLILAQAGTAIAWTSYRIHKLRSGNL